MEYKVCEKCKAIYAYFDSPAIAPRCFCGGKLDFIDVNSSEVLNASISGKVGYLGVDAVFDPEAINYPTVSC